MQFLADKSYLALKPQSDAMTPVIPTIHFPLKSESIEITPSIEADRRMMGLDWKSNDVLRGAREVDGEIVVEADVNVLAHLFNTLETKGSSTGSASDGYTHPFTPGNGDHYTVEVPRGNFARRFWGVRGNTLVLNFDNDRLQAALTIAALGYFESATLAVALTGSGMTEAVFNQEGLLEPTKGLVVGDVITVGGVNVTLTSVDADGITVGFASTAITASVGDPVYLRAQTPSFGTVLKPLMLENVLVGIGEDETEATTNAASKSTASPAAEIEIEFNNNIIKAGQSGYVGAGALLNGVLECQIRFNRLFETPDQTRKWLEMTKQAITIVMKGKFIKSDFTTQELFTVKAHKVKLIDNPNTLNVGEYVMDEQEFEVLYDEGDAKSIENTIVNTIAGSTL